MIWSDSAGLGLAWLGLAWLLVACALSCLASLGRAWLRAMLGLFPAYHSWVGTTTGSPDPL
eukprot:6425736-Alexandrium_andersonii.AAC.1